MASPAMAVRNRLLTDTINFSKGSYSIFTSQEPMSPDECITIYDTGGKDRYMVLGDGSEDIMRPTIQIRVRGKALGYSLAWDMAESIQEYIRSGKFDYEYDGAHYGFGSQIGGLSFLMNDDSNRPIIVLNFVLFECKVV